MPRKVKTKDVKSIYTKKCGKRNNIPKEICSVIEKLEKLDFINHIAPGIFRNSNNGIGIKIIGYDEKSRTYHINVSTGKYEQKIILGVHNEKPEYERQIKQCL